MNLELQHKHILLWVFPAYFSHLVKNYSEIITKENLNKNIDNFY